jgi:membrane protein DedA with SNARE-associated domain
LADWLSVLIVGIILVAIGYILKRVMTEAIIKKLGYGIEIIGIVVIVIAIILLVVAFV